MRGKPNGGDIIPRVVGSSSRVDNPSGQQRTQTRGHVNPSPRGEGGDPVFYAHTLQGQRPRVQGTRDVCGFRCIGEGEGTLVSKTEGIEPENSVIVLGAGNHFQPAAIGFVTLPPYSR